MEYTKEQYRNIHEAAIDTYEACKFARKQIMAWVDFRPELKPYTEMAAIELDRVIKKAEGK